MKDEFINRLGMFQTSLDKASEPAHKAVWFNQPPAIVGTKITAATAGLADLKSWCQQHGIDLTGRAIDKDREESDVENAAHALGSLLCEWYRDHADETNAAICARSLTGWRSLRDQELIAQARIVRDLGIIVAAIPPGQNPPTPGGNDYGIDSSKVQNLTTQINEYEAIVTLPQTGIAGRKAIGAQLRSRFAAVEAIFASIDNLILAFNGTEAGRAFIAAWKEARVIRDLGAGPATPPAPTPPPPGP